MKALILLVTIFSINFIQSKPSLSEIIISLNEPQVNVNLNKKSTIEDILSSLPQRFCPMRGFNGESYCPPSSRSLEVNRQIDATNSNEISKNEIDSNGDAVVSTIQFDENNKEKYVKISPLRTKIVNSEEKNVPRILSGFGFDRVKREMKFPVYPSNSPVASHHTENRVKSFNDINEFINFVRGSHSNQEAGLYVRDYSVIEHIGTAFGDASAKLGITQKLVRTHATTIQSSNAIDIFKQAVESLPPYNSGDANSKQQYRMLIDFWGTDVATNVNHGGIVYQTTAIKKCFGGNINEGMIDDIESAINRRTPGSGYLRYRQLGVFEARGGNPELGSNRMIERINSFGGAPAPINWDSVPLWNAVENPTRRVWVQQAVTDYINENQQTPNQIINKIKAAEIANYNRVRNLYVADITHGHQGGLSYRWEGCGYVQPSRSFLYTPHCALLRPVQQLAATQNRVLDGILGSQRVIERDGNGLVRIRITLNGNTLAASNWVRTGCAVLKHPGTLTWGRNVYPLGMFLSRAVCIDCLPHIQHQAGEYGTTHTLLTCVCDHF